MMRRMEGLFWVTTRLPETSGRTTAAEQEDDRLSYHSDGLGMTCT